MSPTDPTPAKPRVAVLYTGHMRTFARCFPTHCDHLRELFEGADFFVSTVRDSDTASVQLIKERYPKALVSVHVVDSQPELPIPVKPTNPEWKVGMMYSHESYAISVHPQAVLRQLWQLNEAWKAFSQAPQGYDIIVRIRPDLWFRSFEMKPMREVAFRHPLYSRTMPPPPEDRWTFGSHDAHTPWWGRFGGINDRFAILGATAAQAYFTTYDRIPELIAKGYPLHPERLVWASLKESGCHIDDTLLATFSKLYGADCPDPQLRNRFRDPEILNEDIANLCAKR
jgi:hypothetical protein